MKRLIVPIALIGTIMAAATPSSQGQYTHFLKHAFSSRHTLSTLATLSVVSVGIGIYYAYRWLNPKPTEYSYQVVDKDGSVVGNLILRVGDMLAQPADAIVNAANEKLLGGGGVDGLIHEAAGTGLEQFNHNIKEVTPNTRCSIGDARISPSFNLQKRGIHYIISTVGPRGDNPNREELLKKSYTSCINLAICFNQYLAKKNEDPALQIAPAWYKNFNQLPTDSKTPIQTIAFPIISGGIYGYDVQNSAPHALKAIIKAMQSTKKPMKIISCFGGKNPKPETALLIYQKYIQKTLNEHGQIAYPDLL